MSVPYAQKDSRFLFEMRRGQPWEFWSLISTIIFFFFFSFSRSSSALHRRSSTAILPNYWGTFCAGVCLKSVFSFPVAAGFEPTSLRSGCLNHYVDPPMVLHYSSTVCSVGFSPTPGLCGRTAMLNMNMDW